MVCRFSVRRAAETEAAKFAADWVAKVNDDPIRSNGNFGYSDYRNACFGNPGVFVNFNNRH
jgi:hypothetical protein